MQAFSSVETVWPQSFQVPHFLTTVSYPAKSLMITFHNEWSSSSETSQPLPSCTSPQHGAYLPSDLFAFIPRMNPVIDHLTFLKHQYPSFPCNINLLPNQSSKAKTESNRDCMPLYCWRKIISLRRFKQRQIHSLSPGHADCVSPLPRLSQENPCSLGSPSSLDQTTS